jgi:hypothetical protein
VLQREQSPGVLLPAAPVAQSHLPQRLTTAKQTHRSPFCSLLPRLLAARRLWDTARARRMSPPLTAATTCRKALSRTHLVASKQTNMVTLNLGARVWEGVRGRGGRAGSSNSRRNRLLSKASRDTMVNQRRHKRHGAIPARARQAGAQPRMSLCRTRQPGRPSGAAQQALMMTHGARRHLPSRQPLLRVMSPKCSRGRPALCAQEHRLL